MYYRMDFVIYLSIYLLYYIVITNIKIYFIVVSIFIMAFAPGLFGRFSFDQIQVCSVAAAELHLGFSSKSTRLGGAFILKDSAGSCDSFCSAVCVDRI